MANYDIVISASCYYSPFNAIRLLKSLSVIRGSVLPIITCPRIEDALEVAAYARDNKIRALILQSDNKQRHFCQSIAFVYCVKHNISARYFAVTDDDIEFIDGEILPRLNSCTTFSVMGFSSNQILYGSTYMVGKYRYGEYIEGPPWIDANNMWTQWETNLLAGLPDCATDSNNAAFVECEYEHRLHLLTGKPIVGCSYRPIHHHTRIDDMEKRRGNINIVVEGYRLWQEKFGLALDGSMFESGKGFGWVHVEQILSKPEYQDLYLKHLIFGGLWLDWDAIWYKYGSGVQTIYEALK